MKKYLLLIYCSLFISHSLFSQQWMGSVHISGAGNEISEAIIADELQNTYVSGNFTQEIKFLTETVVSKGAADIFVIKYDDNNEELWHTTIGSKQTDYVSNLTLTDEALFVAGCFSDSCIIGKDTLVSLGNTDIFLAKYDKQTGTALQAFHIVGGTGMLLLTGLSTDNSGNILVSGTLIFGDAGFPPFDNTVLTGAVGFLAKYDTNGNYLWHTSFSNSSLVSNVVATDDNYYVVNTGKGNINIKDATETSYEIQSPSTVNYIQLISLDTNGKYQWAEISSSSSPTSVKSIKMDSKGVLFMAGLFENGDLAFAGKSLGLNHTSGSKDIYIISTNPLANSIDNNSIYGTSISSTGDNNLYGLELQNDVLYITGKINGTVTFNKDVVTAGMFVASYMMDDEDKSFNAVGAVPGISGASDTKGIVFSAKGFKIIGGFNSGITIGDDTYTNQGIDTYLAKACPIIAIDTFDFKHVSGCNALAKNGEIKIDVKGGIIPSSYILMKDGFGEVANQTTNHFASLDTGKYTTTVLYNDGYCSKDLSFTIEAPQSLSFKKITTPTLTCNSGETGAMEISINNPSRKDLEYYARGIIPSNQSQIYFRDWRDGPIDTAMFVNCPVGQYTIKVRFKEDATCETSYIISISPIETGATITVSAGDYTCNPANIIPSGDQGVVKVNVSDPEKGEWFSLVDAVTGATVQRKSLGDGQGTNEDFIFDDRASAGTYAVLAGEIGSTCMLSDTITIEQPDPIVVQSVKTSGALCYGEASGKITIAAYGDGTSLDYELFIKNEDDGYTPIKNGNFSDRIQISGLLAGTYKLELTDNVNGMQTCAYAYPYEIVVPNVGTEFGLSVADSSSLCYGTTNSGYIHFNLTGGTAGRYTYTLTGGNNPPQNITGRFNNLPAGTYQAKVMEQANGCVYDYPEPIELILFPEILTGSVTPKDVLCNGEGTGEISIASVSGGSGNYTVTATNTASSAIHTATGTNPYKMEGLIKGTYAISIKDDVTKCTPSPLSNVTIGEPDVLEFETRTKEDIKCYGNLTGKVIVAAKGGKADAQNPYQYSLTYSSVTHTQASGTFEGLVPGFYSVTVEDNNQCTANSGALEITQPADIEIKTVTPTDVVCFDESNGSINVTEVIGGTISSTYKYTLSNIDGTSPIDNGTSPIFAGLKAKSYKLSVRDDYNCLKEMSPIVINQPEKLLVSGDLKIKPESCKAPDGTIQITVTGGIAPYSFSSGGSYSESQYASTYKFSGLTADQYTINVKDKNGCMIDPKNVDVEKNSLTAGAVATEIKCFKDKSMLIVNASSSHAAEMKSFSLYKGGTLFKEETSAVFNNLEAGSYYVAVVDTNGCTVTTPTVLITRPDQIDVSVDMKSASGQTVADGALTVKVSGGTPFDGDKYKFVLKSNSELVADILTTSPNTFGNLLPARYGIEIWDKNDCSLGTMDEVDIKTGIRNKDANELKLYPNPSDGRFYIQWSQEKDMSLNVEIFNMAGKLVYKNVVPVGAGTSETLIDISGQSKGTYILRVRELNVQQKLIIQ
ncbi:MAG: T9SS type A sorting domain-containing protein [Bacteroidales bacterium]|jgi:uncharacterized protein (DUF2141 family)|nr:T9SS type A sorting domain-containing protein [Bacteroidales bacterium]